MRGEQGMKKEYEAPEFEVMRFESEDIITASGITPKADTLTKESLLIYNF